VGHAGARGGHQSRPRGTRAHVLGRHQRRTAAQPDTQQQERPRELGDAGRRLGHAAVAHSAQHEGVVRGAHVHHAQVPAERQLQEGHDAGGDVQQAHHSRAAPLLAARERPGPHPQDSCASQLHRHQQRETVQAEHRFRGRENKEISCAIAYHDFLILNYRYCA